MKSEIENLTVVIRSVQERTEELCKKLILEQGIDEKNLFVIRETPFSKAMRVGYQKGIENGLKWTYCIDADVLLADYSIAKMLTIANKQSEEVFTISAKLVDKFFNSTRRVGNHLFRTSSLSSMISNIAPYENEGIRPETDAKNKLIEKGGVEHKVNDIIGLHDFEQHYEDIARKTFVHANKHAEYLGKFVPHWKAEAKNDEDFKAALIGLAEGLKSFEHVKINDTKFEFLKELINNSFEKKSENVNSFEINNFKKIQLIIDGYKEKKINEISYSYKRLVKLLGLKIKIDIKKLFKNLSGMIFGSCSA